MATLVANTALAMGKYELLGLGFTAEEVQEKEVEAKGKKIKLVKPSERHLHLKDLAGAIAVDFSTPDAYLPNCMFYIQNEIPFVIGTTGATKEQIKDIKKRIRHSKISAVIDQNMSIELVLIGSALDYLANTFPNALKGHTGYGIDSHQKNKKDRISGTLIKWGTQIKELGVKFHMAEGARVAEYGHAYHDIRIMNQEGNVRITLNTAVEGRDTYMHGTFKAVDFLMEKMGVEKGKVYSMTDVLKG